jgi:putative colanic acid biosynthesis UDP-glucose lipid carrier transferase
VQLPVSAYASRSPKAIDPFPTALISAPPGGVLRHYARDLSRAQRLLDPLGVGLVLLLVAVLVDEPIRLQEQLLAAAAAGLIFSVAPFLGLYGSFRESSHWSLLRRVATLWSVYVGAVTLGLFSLKVGQLFSRELMLLWFLGSGLWLVTLHIGSRQLLRKLRIHGFNSRWDGYVGSVAGFDRLRYEIEASSWLGHTLQPMLLWSSPHGPDPELLNQFESNLQGSLPDQWLVEDCSDPERLQQLLSILEDQTSPVLLLPRWLRGGHYRPEFFQLGSIAALQLWGSRGTPLELKLKRSMDLIASGILLVLLSPLLALIAIAIRLDSPGPVLFRQRRYGLEGESFDCLKFRTMRVQENGAVVEQARQHDPRVTGLGRWLRSWNLDELPQLLNVWRGQMSLVGPRPHAAAHNEYYRTRVRGYMRRHALRPGLTGWAQVMGLRGRTETLDRMEARVSADLDYIQNWSLRLDFKILLLTLLRWRNEHAY